MGKRGRKPQVPEITERMVKEVEKFVAHGLTQELIAGYYGMQRNAWYAYTRKYPELYEAMRKGKTKAVDFAGGKLYQLVKKGNLNAIIFYLKTQGAGSYVDNKPLDDEGEEKKHPRVVINVNDPIEAAKMYQELMKD